MIAQGYKPGAAVCLFIPVCRRSLTQGFQRFLCLSLTPSPVPSRRACSAPFRSQELSAPHSVTKRDGKWVDLPARELCMGDVLMLKVRASVCARGSEVFACLKRNAEARWRECGVGICWAAPGKTVLPGQR